MKFLVAFLLCSPLFADWEEIRSPHFTVITDAGARKGQETAHYFEQMRYVFESQLPQVKVDGDKDLIVFAVRSEKSLAELVPGFIDGKKRGYGGVFFPGMLRNHIVVRTDMGDFGFHAIIHEYTHLLISNSLSKVPLWMNEGLAEFFGSMEILSGRVNIGLVNDYAAILNRTKFIPLPVLASLGHNSEWYNEEARSNIFYAQSWLLTHYAMMSEEGRKQKYLTQLLQRYNQGEDPVFAMEQVFGSYEDLTEKLRRYLEKNRFPYYTIKTELKLAREKYPITKLSPVQADAYRAVLRTGNSAGPVTDANLAEMKQAPQDDDLATNLGLTLLYLDRKAEALDQFRLAEKPGKNWLAHFILGSWDETSKETKLARFEEAVRLNPKFAGSAYELAFLLVETDPERALVLANQALVAKPSFFGTRLLMAQILMKLGRTDEAAKEGRKALILAETGAERDLIKALIVTPLEEGMVIESLPSPTHTLKLKAEGKVRVMWYGYSRDNFYKEPLLKAIWTLNSDETAVEIEKPDAVKQRSFFDETPLHLAAERGDLALTKALLAHGADLEAKDAAQWTPLLVAIAENNLEVAQALVEAGASVTALNEEGQSALMWACLQGDLPLVKLLFHHKADRALVDKSGRTALDYLDADKAKGLLTLMKEFKAPAGKGPLDKAMRRARADERQQAMRRVYEEKTGEKQDELEKPKVQEEAYTSNKVKLTAQCNQAVDAFAAGNYDKAHRLLDRILADDSNFEPALDLYVHLLLTEEKVPEADAYLQRFAKVASNQSNLAERYFQVAKALMRDEIDGDTGRKIELYLKTAWTKSDSKLLLTQYWLGDLYLMFGAEEQAFDAYTRYVDTGDTSNWIYIARDRIESLRLSLARKK